MANQQKTIETPAGVKVTGVINEGYETVLTQDALEFVKLLHQKFNKTRLELLQKRVVRQAEIDGGKLPDFLPETKHIRESEWTVAPLPVDLLDRRVEITGPVERKMIINALNSGAKVFMADFEDSNTPSWENNISGQLNLRDAINKTISYVNPDNGKSYQLNDKTATLLVRPRGWHLEEKHITCDGEVMSGGLVDFGLYFFHNVKNLLAKGTGPYFYLPKMESHLEARLWNDVFVFAQDYLKIPQKTIKATVLIETILATFELHEILWELKDHSCGLNCGRWDYIFSYIKKFKKLPGFVLPDRGKVTMRVPFMSAYSQLVIQTCHKRNVHAMGGMAAFIPIKGDDVANKAVMDKVRDDKMLEATNGHDGTWVAHPGLVQLAMDVFNEKMPNANQIDKKREDVKVVAKDLITPCEGSISEAGLRMNINVAILYIESWLRGIGAAAIHNLMEDAATAEISRAQVWQWIRNKSVLEDGRTITYDLCKQIIPEELAKAKEYVGTEISKNGRFDDAVKIFDSLIKGEEFAEFLTLPAYNLL